MDKALRTRMLTVWFPGLVRGFARKAGDVKTLEVSGEESRTWQTRVLLVQLLIAGSSLLRLLYDKTPSAHLAHRAIEETCRAIIAYWSQRFHPRRLTMGFWRKGSGLHGTVKLTVTCVSRR